MISWEALDELARARDLDGTPPPEHQREDPLIRAALSIATRAHAGQVDKAGQAYIAHPAAVAATLTEQDQPAHVVAAGWLHDVVEDTTWTPADLTAELADTAEPDQLRRTVHLVELLTHRDHEPRADYYARIATDPEAVVVKAADIAHNTSPGRMAALDEPTRARLVAKYRAARTALGLPEAT